MRPTTRLRAGIGRWIPDWRAPPLSAHCGGPLRTSLASSSQSPTSSSIVDPATSPVSKAALWMWRMALSISSRASQTSSRTRRSFSLASALCSSSPAAKSLRMVTFRTSGSGPVTSVSGYVALRPAWSRWSPLCHRAAPLRHLRVSARSAGVCSGRDRERRNERPQSWGRQQRRQQCGSGYSGDGDRSAVGQSPTRLGSPGPSRPADPPLLLDRPRGQTGPEVAGRRSRSECGGAGRSSSGPSPYDARHSPDRTDTTSSTCQRRSPPPTHSLTPTL